MQKIITAALIVVAVIHLIPVTGVMGGDRLSALYGLSLQEPNISILMRHRAILFGLMGLFFLYAAFKPALQPLAFVAGFTSVLSFFVLSWLVGDFNEAIRKIIIGDIVAFISLVLAWFLYVISSRRRTDVGP